MKKITRVIVPCAVCENRAGAEEMIHSERDLFSSAAFSAGKIG